MKAIPIILAPMERCREGWLKLDGKRYYFDPETGIMYKNCTIEKTERAIHR